MDINLLEHSTYNVDQIRKNKEFVANLLGQIESTYQIFNKTERSESNRQRIEFAPATNRRQNVYMEMNVDGELKITFCGVNAYSDKKRAELKPLTDKYKNSEYTGGLHIEMQKITAENYKEFLPDIVKCIEWIGYSFR